MRFTFVTLSLSKGDLSPSLFRRRCRHACEFGESDGLECRFVDADVIVVHDAARPLATPALFNSVVDAVLAGADGAVPGLAISDTVKRIRHDGDVTLVGSTETRDELVTVQTPQAFTRDALVRAHANGDEATDDAALVEALGGRVVVVPGELDNVKITVPGDLATASSIVSRR